jgi:transcriptional regulator with GAF, ATPase, and Fis domain
MFVDEKEFFREATLRICGSLEIEKALHRCLLYIRDFIPADMLVLSYLIPDIGVQRHLAEATPEGGKRSDFVTSLPPDILARVKDMIKQGNLPKLELIEHPETHPIAGLPIRSLRKENSSLIIVRLILEGQFIGGLSVLAEGRGRHTRQHADLLGLLREPFAIALSNYLRYREVLELKERLADDNRYLQDELQHISGDEIIGANFGLKGVMEMVRQVAPLVSPVLLLGATGTGKEVIASAIHNASPRQEDPFIKVNCGAIPETLMDSELFGHEKGAFTGALSQKRGRFERAHGGTIFLDEIGELTPDAQVRLLRVLQEKEIERVGGTKPIKVDIRVIAATHRDLQAMIAEGRFREDLYFRLKVFPIAIPPLRERVGDIPALVQHFMQKKSREMKLIGIPTLTPGAIDRLMAYHWPGNVRELENAVERALILSRGEPLTFSDLQPPGLQDTGQSPIPSEGDLLNLDQVTVRHIRRVLEMTGGKVEGERGAAKLLGINPGTLRHRMRKLGIPFGRNARKKQDG